MNLLILLSLLAAATASPAPVPHIERVASEIDLPDGWEQAKIHRYESPPRTFLVAVHKKSGARIVASMGDPLWPSPGAWLGRLARWHRQAGWRVEAVSGLRPQKPDTDNDQEYTSPNDVRDASFDMHDAREGVSGRIHHYRFRATSASERGPILQVSGRWPRGHHKKMRKDFNEIFHALAGSAWP